MAQRSLLSLCIILVLSASAVAAYYFLTRDQAQESAVNPEFPFERNNALNEPPFDLASLPGTLLLPSGKSSYTQFDLSTQRGSSGTLPPGIEGDLLDMVSSPKGDVVAYITAADSKYNLAFKGADWEYTFRLKAPLADLAWSPDGSMVAFSSFRPEMDGWTVFTLDLSGDKKKLEAFSETPGHSPQFLSNNSIVYLRENALYTTTIGGAPDLVTTFDGVPPQLADAASFNIPSLSVSSDRTQLAFSNPLEETIYLVDLVGGIPRGDVPSQKVRFLNVGGYDPIFSPDGAFLAIVHPIDGIIVFSTESLLGWVVAPLPENTWLNNPIFAWVTDTP